MHKNQPNTILNKKPFEIPITQIKTLRFPTHLQSSLQMGLSSLFLFLSTVTRDAEPIDHATTTNGNGSTSRN